MANPAAITIHASAAETTTATGAAVDLGATRSCVKLDLIVTAVSGTNPLLTIALDTAPSATGPWRAAGSFTAVAVVGKSSKTFADLDQFVRENRTIGGTAGPTFTYSDTGFAHTLYASPSDLTKTAIAAAALTNVPADTIAECCLRSSADFETAANSSHTLPLTGWGEDVRGHCASRAVFYALSARGRKPSGNMDEAIDQLGGFALRTPGAKSAAEMFFQAIAKGVLKPLGVVDQTPDDFEGGGFVVSGEARNW